MVKAQKWLDQNYPSQGTCLRKGKLDGDIYYKEKIHQDFGKTRDEIEKLRIDNENLEETLDLSDFKNLEELSCIDNFLTNLKVNNCLKLKEIYCSNNQLTTINLGNLAELEGLTCFNNYLTQIIYPTNPERLTELLIFGNKVNSDLSIFFHLTNLKKLDLG